MKEAKPAGTELLEERIAELGGLIAKWEHVKDPESKWMLFLLREALEMGRIRLNSRVRKEGKALARP